LEEWLFAFTERQEKPKTSQLSGSLHHASNGVKRRSGTAQDASLLAYLFTIDAGSGCTAGRKAVAKNR